VPIQCVTDMGRCRFAREDPLHGLVQAWDVGDETVSDGGELEAYDKGASVLVAGE
jgi:hypothetical protein